jgi:NMD protein affecting ribosome stability and mRNA decay
MKAERGGFRMLQHEQLLKELVHDSYKMKSKLAEPARCKECGAVYRRGRWTWEPATAPAHDTLCPACHRMRDGMPAGYVSLAGEFFREHREEVLRRVRNCEADEKREHPLERIMAMSASGEGMLVTTTDTHLAHRIGQALRKSWKGEVEFHYNKEDNLLRVSWRR